MRHELDKKNDAMSPGELDGLVAGLLVYPDSVPPSQWLPHAWVNDARLESIEEAEIESVLIGRCNGVARVLANEPRRCAPASEEEEGTENVFWVEWMFGFERATLIRLAAWTQDEMCKMLNVVDAVRMMYSLYGAFTGEGRLGDEQFAVLDPLAPGFIRGIVRDPNAWEMSRGASVAEPLVPDPPWDADAMTSRDVACGFGPRRPYGRCCGVH